MADTVLLIGAEVFSRILDFRDRQTAILFGDGAGAAVIQASERPGIEGTVLGADGSRRGDPPHAGRRLSRAGDARDRRGGPAPDPDAERPRGVQAGGHRDGGGVPAGPGEERAHRGGRRPADPPPGERPHHGRGRRTPRRPAREGRGGRGGRRQHAAPRRSRSRSIAPVARAG